LKYHANQPQGVAGAQAATAMLKTRSKPNLHPQSVHNLSHGGCPVTHQVKPELAQTFTA